MLAIYRKEINAFFSSLAGYMVLGTFLVLLGLLLFVFPGSSLLEYGQATLEPLFDNAPLLFLILLPALTMRAFAEERMHGTIETLMTKPLRSWEIVGGKYLAVMTLVFFSLVPTLLYYYTIYQLASPVGNVDTGAIAGSYIGLFLLAGVFAAIGMFASTWTSSQIAAFAFAALSGFLLLNGFDYFSELPVFVGRGDDLVQKLGIQYHYRSLSRGVLDSRDILYFLSLIALFLALTHWALYRGGTLRLGLIAGILLFTNVLANARFGDTALYGYLDLTADKRYTLTKGTRQLLRGLDDVLFVKVLLGGEFPAKFKRLQTATEDMLEDFRSESGFVEYQFEDPFAGPVKAVNSRLESYREEGLRPVSLTLPGQAERTTKAVLPYAIVYFKGRSLPVYLMEGGPALTDQSLNKAIRFLEYKLANALRQIQRAEKPAIAFTAAHGELDRYETADLERSLRQYYNTGRLILDSVPRIDPNIAVLVVAKPRTSFSEKDKFKIDQYVMQGGKVLWLLDAIAVDLDSLSGRKEFMPSEYRLGLDDLLFRYGIRIQPNLVLDMQCTGIKLVTGQMGDQPQLQSFDYPYHLFVNPNTDHPVVKNLGSVNLLYPSSIDTAVRTKTDIRRTVLLRSTPRSRYQLLPLRMDFDFMRYPLDPAKFDKGPQPLALLLEGQFPSMYENRLTQDMQAGLERLGAPFRALSPYNRMIVVSDGDIARNAVNRQTGEIIPLGYNRFTEYTFDNKDFLLNAIEYLLDDAGVVEARGKNVDLRLLDSTRAQAERGKWRLLNLAAPLVGLLLFGTAYQALRRRRYGRA